MYNRYINTSKPHTSSNKTNGFDIFYEKFQIRKYKKDEMLIRADDDPFGVFCLIQGYVRQYTISEAGLELTLHILKPTSYFPMFWAVNETPNIYFYESLTSVQVRRAPRKEVINFIKDKPDVILDLMSKLLEDYRESLNRIEHLVFSDAYRRVVSTLLYIAKHLGVEKGTSVIVDHRFTQQDIATLVGVARETAGVELAKLEKSGLIKYINHSLLFESIEDLSAELSTIQSEL